MNESKLEVIITGIPRSGTSFLAGLISKMGYSLGPKEWIKGADRHNKSGYYESLPLLQLSEKILKKLNGDFHYNIPAIQDRTFTNFQAEKQQIRKIVDVGSIQAYKGNRLMVIGDLYAQLFPGAKWIYISRDSKASYRSRFGAYLSYEDWISINNKRKEAWYKSEQAERALELRFEDFQHDFESTLYQIASYLDISISEKQLNACQEFYQPKSVRHSST